MNIDFQKSILTAVELMAISAKTAPKSGGSDFVGIKIIQGDDLQKLGNAMISYGEKEKKHNFDRDGNTVKLSDAVLILSLENSKPLGLNCGACGMARCADLKTKEGPEFKGPLCAWRLLDLGTALGSAVKTASLFNLDNRIMYRVGAVAKIIKMIEGDIVVGVPVSVTGKNIFFDRK